MTYVVVLVGVAALVSLVLLTWNRGLWGTTRVGQPAGEGAYREGVVTVAVPRGVPSSVIGASVSAWIWGVMTTLGFAPAGGVLALVIMDSHRPGPTVVAALAVLAVVISGVLGGIALMIAGTSIATRSVDAPRTARSVARWSRAHHAAVLSTLGAVTGFGEPSFAVVAIAMLAAPCAIGVIVAGILDRAARRIDRIGDDDARESAASPLAATRSLRDGEPVARVRSYRTSYRSDEDRSVAS